MGQYHYVCNLDKHEFLHPHKFGDGLKLMEFGAGGPGTMTGLALLLAASNGPDGRGGGDWHPWVDGVGSFSAETYGADRTLSVDTERARDLATSVPGRWAGNCIAIIGDSAEDGDPGVDTKDTPWTNKAEWRDISDTVLEALRLDYYLSSELPEPIGEGWGSK